MNCGKAGRRKVGFRSSQCSGVRKFNIASAKKVEDLKQIKLKKKTAAKVHWAVRAYNEWREVRISDPSVDINIVAADLNKLDFLDKKAFECSMCYFICEVTKKKDGAPISSKNFVSNVRSHPEASQCKSY